MPAGALLADREAALLEAARAGDRRAFGVLLELYHAQSLALATAITGNREDALDAVQEASLKAFRALHTFRPGRPFFPWFYRIVRNTCLQQLRRRRVRRRVQAPGQGDGREGWPELADPRAPRPEELLQASERSRRLGEALARLGRDDREILLLKHVQNLTYQDIAGILGIPAGTVMSRLHTARRRLRRLLPELEP